MAENPYNPPSEHAPLPVTDKKENQSHSSNTDWGKKANQKRSKWVVTLNKKNRPLFVMW